MGIPFSEPLQMCTRMPSLCPQHSEGPPLLQDVHGDPSSDPAVSTAPGGATLASGHARIPHFGTISDRARGCPFAYPQRSEGPPLLQSGQPGCPRPSLLMRRAYSCSAGQVGARPSRSLPPTPRPNEPLLGPCPLRYSRARTPTQLRATAAPWRCRPYRTCLGLTRSLTRSCSPSRGHHGH